jgi:hypothetical protein
LFTIPFHGRRDSRSGECGGRFLLLLQPLFSLGFGALAGGFPFLGRRRSRRRGLAERVEELAGALFGIRSECG